MEEPNREEIMAMIEITDANRLPYDLNELRTKVINWREVTNDFDFYTIRDIINRWSDDNEQRIVARIIGSNMGVDKTRGIHVDYLEAAINLTCMYQYRPGTDKRKNMEKLVSYLEERYRKRLISDFKSYKKGLTAQVGKLKSDLEKANNLLKKREEEFKREQKIWKHDCDEAYHYKKCYDENQLEIKLLKDLLDNKNSGLKFNVRQTAIIGYALCSKAKVLPKNKKNIAPLFNMLTGRSANTIGQNMCSVYKEDEIEQIAKAVEDKMPEFAEYLREKSFFLPEMQK